MSKSYKFFCIICGTEMHIKKKHAKTCSTACRVAYSNIMMQNVVEDEDLSDEDRKLADEKIAEATGGEVRGLVGKLVRKEKDAKK